MGMFKDIDAAIATMSGDCQVERKYDGEFILHKHSILEEIKLLKDLWTVGYFYEQGGGYLNYMLEEFFAKMFVEENHLTRKDCPTDAYTIERFIQGMFHKIYYEYDGSFKTHVKQKEDEFYSIYPEYKGRSLDDIVVYTPVYKLPDFQSDFMIYEELYNDLKGKILKSLRGSCLQVKRKAISSDTLLMALNLSNKVQNGFNRYDILTIGDLEEFYLTKGGIASYMRNIGKGSEKEIAKALLDLKYSGALSPIVEKHFPSLKLM